MLFIYLIIFIFNCIVLFKLTNGNVHLNDGEVIIN